VLPFLVAATGAAAPTDEPLDALIVTLAHDIEAIAGRPFGDLPSARWVDRKEYRELLLDRAGGGGFDEEHRRLSEGMVGGLWSHLGVYYSDQDTIVLLKDKLADIQEGSRLDDAETASMLRCLLVHELVHALDARHHEGPDFGEADWDQLQAYRLLKEGHATWVELQWCRRSEGSAAAARAVSQAQVISSIVATDPEAPYGWGSRFVAALHRDDPEAYWTLLESPPSYRLVQMALSPIFAPGWTDGAPIDDALRRLGFVENQGVSPDALVGFLDRIGLTDRAAPPRATAGLKAHGGYVNRFAQVRAYAVDSDRDAQQVVQRRARQAKAQGVRTPTWFDDGDLPPIEAVEVSPCKRLAREGITGQIVEFETSFLRYYELWAAHEGRLVVVSTNGLRGVKPKHLEIATAALLADLPPSGQAGSVDLAVLRAP